MIAEIERRLWDSDNPRDVWWGLLLLPFAGILLLHDLWLRLRAQA